MKFTASIKIQRLHEEATTPIYATRGAACFDLFPVFDNGVAEIEIAPGRSANIGTGLAFEIPDGWRMDVYSRSGQAFKHGIRLGNCVGKIDADYRGELRVLLHNDSRKMFVIKKGLAFAQGEINPVFRASFVEADELGETERGADGFGSTDGPAAG